MRAIVGNGPLTAQDHKLIASAKHITRFNLAANATNAECTRTDELFLSSSSKQIGDFLSRGTYKSHKVFTAAQRIVFPYHPEIIQAYMPSPTWLSRLKGRRKDWTDTCLKIARDTGKNTAFISPEAYFEACEALSIQPGRKDFFPSSGFLAILRAVNSPQVADRDLGDLHLFGFSFAGWKRHLWEGEKRIVTALQTQGKLTLHEN